jgi:hypothetical protein
MPVGSTCSFGLVSYWIPYRISLLWHGGTWIGLLLLLGSRDCSPRVCRIISLRLEVAGVTSIWIGCVSIRTCCMGICRPGLCLITGIIAGIRDRRRWVCYTWRSCSVGVGLATIALLHGLLLLGSILLLRDHASLVTSILLSSIMWLSRRGLHGLHGWVHGSRTRSWSELLSFIMDIRREV